MGAALLECCGHQTLPDRPDHSGLEGDEKCGLGEVARGLKEHRMEDQ